MVKKKKELEVVYLPLDELIPYARNSRTHSEEQVAQIAASIKEFGFTNPVLIDGENGIIAGHGRILAARKAKLSTVPCIRLDHLTEAQKRALVIADNKLALNAGWDFEMLAVEIDELKDEGYNIDLLGFSLEELAELVGTPGAGDDDGLDDEYTKKITIPVYEPKGEKPEIAALTDAEKAKELIAAVMASEVSDDEKAFLLTAAQRHVVFDYHQIAEYYCHASPEMQALMERSALVLIDFNKAVAEGYVAMTKKLEGVYSESYGDDAE